MKRFIVRAQHATADYSEVFVDEAESVEELEKRLRDLGYDIDDIMENEEE
jgi:hypothetical protein